MDEDTTQPDPSPDAGGSVANEDDDVAAQRDLVLALLANRRGGPHDPEPELLVGKVPDGLPFAPPLPEGSRLLGTLVMGGDLTIALECAMAHETVLAWYEERLLAAGWKEMPPRVRPHGGFVQAKTPRSEMPRLPVTAFVLGEDGPVLTLGTLAGSGGRTIVHLNVSLAGATLERMRHGWMGGRGAWEAMPELLPPPESQHWPDGAMGGNERVHTHGRLQTTLDLGTAAARYGEQLEQQGWQRRDEGTTGPVAWSQWSFTGGDGEPGRGLLIIVQRADGPGQYWIHLVAELAGKRAPANQNGEPRLLGWQAHHRQEPGA